MKPRVGSSKKTQQNEQNYCKIAYGKKKRLKKLKL